MGVMKTWESMRGKTVEMHNTEKSDHREEQRLRPDRNLEGEEELQKAKKGNRKYGVGRRRAQGHEG